MIIEITKEKTITWPYTFKKTMIYETNLDRDVVNNLIEQGKLKELDILLKDLKCIGETTETTRPEPTEKVRYITANILK